MSSFKIRATSLNATAQARLGVQQVDLDLPSDFSLRLFKSIEQLNAFNQIEREAALRFDLPFSIVNDAVFIDYDTPATLDRKSKHIDVVVYMSTTPLPFAQLIVLRKDMQRQRWEVELRSGEAHWSEAAANKAINTIDFGTFEFEKANVLASWDKSKYEGDFTAQANTSEAFYFPVVDYGGWVDQAEPDEVSGEVRKMVALEDLRPFVNLAYLLKKGFAEIGWELGGALLDTEWFRRLWVYALRSNYFEGFGADGQMFGKKHRVINRQLSNELLIDTLSSNPNKFIYFNTQDYAGQSGLATPHSVAGTWLCGVKNLFPFRAKFRFVLRCELRTLSVPVLPQDIAFAVHELLPNGQFSGEILSEDQTVTLQPSSTQYFSAEFIVALNPDQAAAIHWTSDLGGAAFLIKEGAYFLVEPANEAISRGDIIDANVLRSDVTLLDILKGVMHMTNAVMHTDWVTRKVELLPRFDALVYGQEVGGYFSDRLGVVDVSNDIVDNSQVIAYSTEGLSRYTLLRFKDSDDEAVQEATVLDPPGSRRIFNGREFVEQTEELANPIFEPCVEGQSLVLKRTVFRLTNEESVPTPFLPRLWDNSNGRRSFDVGVRVLFAFGKVKQLNARPASSRTADLYGWIYFDEYALPREDFGYATQLRTWALEGYTEIDGNAVYGRADNDLYSMFYAQYFAERLTGAKVDALMFIRAQDYTSIAFRKRYVFQVKGRPVVGWLSAIRDYTPEVPAPVSFDVSFQKSSNCKAPCNCIFSKCDYVNGLTTDISTSTFNNLRITSFIADGKQYVNAPIALGVMRVIDQGAGAYVTNLIDKLNELRVEFFDFYYSQRVAGGKPAFFSISRPACIAFEVIISDGTNPVLRYTHDAQGQRWQGGGWQAFQVGSSSFDVPDNCATFKFE